MHPHDNTPLKTCTKCGKSKPATAEFFYSHKETSDKLRPDCKACLLARSRARYEANKERAAETSRAWYQANKEKMAEYNREYYQANKEKMKEQSREWGIANRDKKREHNRAYVQRHRERVLAKSRAYHSENKERESEYKRTYYVENKEHILNRSQAYYAANKERYAEYQRASLATNPDRHRLYVRIRRARKLQAEGTHTAEDIQAQYTRQKGKCFYCGCKVGDTYDVDHIVPLSRGGTNWPENLVIACPSCNRSKQNKLPHEWVGSGRLL